MQYRDSAVLVRVDPEGRPVIDTEGRAEMKYREDDPRRYRPHPRNLTSSSADGPAPSPDSAAAPAASRAPRPASARAPRAAARPAPRAAAADSVLLWTDGACTGNPGPMGIGMVVILGDQRLERGEFLGHGTNNIAELTAILRGIELAESLRPGVTEDPGKQLRVFTDSSYSIGVLSQGWKAKANKELIEQARTRLARLPNLFFEKVPGHAGVPDNERCDELAREAIVRRGPV